MPATAGRVKAKDACEILQISVDTLDRLVTREVFTVVRDSARGHRYLLPDELDEYRTGGAIAVKNLRLRTGRLKKGKR